MRWLAFQRQRQKGAGDFVDYVYMNADANAMLLYARSWGGGWVSGWSGRGELRQGLVDVRVSKAGNIND